MVKKINFIVNQLIGSGIFLGYYISNWNPRINYFLLGKYKGVNLFNINQVYTRLKSFMSIISDILIKKGRIWVVNENFDLFLKSKTLLKISHEFRELSFINSRWLKGSLTNARYIKLSRPFRFPHALVVPNLQNNHFVVNEAFLMSIPSFSLVDTVDNPLNVFFPIPGNSKSVRTTYFFYLLISKVVLYSRYSLSSSFLFKSYRKLKFKKRNLINFNFITDFLKKYEYVSKTFYLFKENIYLLMLRLKRIRIKNIIDSVNHLEKSRDRTTVFSRIFLLWIFSLFFMNILKLAFLNFKKKNYNLKVNKTFFYKTVINSVV